MAWRVAGGCGAGAEGSGEREWRDTGGVFRTSGRAGRVIAGRAIVAGLYDEVKGPDMTAIGETLRRERIKRKLGLEQISGELKIPLRLLEAIEEEDFGQLPGRMFTISFVRQYARLLGLDEDDLVGEVRRRLEPPPPPIPGPGGTGPPASEEIHLPQLNAWVAIGEKSRSSSSSALPALALVVGVMLACSGLYSWWQHTHRPAQAVESGRAAARVAQTPAAPAPETPAPEANPPVDPPARAVAPIPRAGESSADRAAASEPSPAPAPALSSSAPSGAVAVRVEVSAEDRVWVSAQGDGKTLFAGIMEPKQSHTLEAGNKVVLRLGNAAAVTILLNGKPIGAVGAKGQVRTVQLTSGGFEIMPASGLLLDPL